MFIVRFSFRLGQVLAFQLAVVLALLFASMVSEFWLESRSRELLVVAAFLVSLIYQSLRVRLDASLLARVGLADKNLHERRVSISKGDRSDVTSIAVFAGGMSLLVSILFLLKVTLSKQGSAVDLLPFVVAPAVYIGAAFLWDLYVEHPEADAVSRDSSIWRSFFWRIAMMMQGFSIVILAIQLVLLFVDGPEGIFVYVPYRYTFVLLGGIVVELILRKSAPKRDANVGQS